MRNALMIILTLSALNTHAQQNTAISVLQKVEKTLAQSQQFSYDYTREIKYFSENYHDRDTARIYFDYNEKGLIGFRFQSTKDKSKFIFDGRQTITLDQNSMTIDSQTINSPARMDASSYLFHSLAMLKILIPQIIQNDTIQKRLSDTLIAGETLYCITMEAPRTYFGSLISIHHFNNAALRRPYYLLIDKKSFLPRQFISRLVRGEDDRDFITMTYTNLNFHPKKPTPQSWNYQSYAVDYHKPRPKEKKKRIEVGSIIPDHKLPVYNGKTAPDTTIIRSLAGKIVLLEFWIKNCGPCMEALPHYNDLQKKYEGTEFKLVTINATDGINDIKFWYDKLHPVYPMLFGGSNYFESLGLDAYPSSILLDKDGKVLHVFVGFNQPELEKEIDAALKASS